MEHIYEIIGRKVRGESNGEDEQAITNWLDQSPDNQKKYRELEKLWEESQPIRGEIEVNPEVAWHTLKDKLQEDHLPIPLHRRHYFMVASIAAVIVAVVFFLRFLTSNGEFRASTDQETISEVQLPDGSNVVLSKSSAITYEEVAGQRTVKLVGQAYFEVEHNPELPFVVNTGGMITQVVGTSFNINFKNEQNVAVSVTSGIVNLYHEESPVKKLTLTKGLTGNYRFKSDSLFEYNQLDPNFLSWKTGILTFNNTPISDVAETLSSHYGSIITVPPGSLEERLTGEFDNLSIAATLELIRLTTEVQLIQKEEGQLQ